MANQKINKWTYPNELANLERCQIANFELYMNQPNYKLGDQYLWVSILYCCGARIHCGSFYFLVLCSFVGCIVFLLFEMVIPNSYSIFNSIAIFHCFPSLLYQKTDFVFFNRFLFQPTFSRLNVLFQLSPSMHLQLNFWPAPIWLYCLPLRKILQVSEITDLSSGFIAWCLVLAVFTSNMFFFF